MYPHYHREITREAVGEWFGKPEFDQVLAGNTSQDHLHGQMCHPEYHFDDSEFTRTYDYMRGLRNNVENAIRTRVNFQAARADYGRFTHASQDFYAHSNYIQLWAAKHKVTPDTWNGQIDPLDETILNHSLLISGHFYTPWEIITFLPVLGKLFIPLFPVDSHAFMNHDSPKNSPWFPMALKAAMLRTRSESIKIFHHYGYLTQII